MSNYSGFRKFASLLAMCGVLAACGGGGGGGGGDGAVVVTEGPGNGGSGNGNPGGGSGTPTQVVTKARFFNAASCAAVQTASLGGASIANNQAYNTAGVAVDVPVGATNSVVNTASGTLAQVVTNLLKDNAYTVFSVNNNSAQPSLALSLASKPHSPRRVASVCE